MPAQEHRLPPNPVISATETKTPRARARWCHDISALFQYGMFDEFPDDQRADHLQDERADDHLNPERIGRQHLHVSGRPRNIAGQRRRHPGENPPGDPAVRREHADLTLDPEAVANDRARLSSTSPRLPPVSRWVSTAVTKNRASMSGMRMGEGSQRVRQRHAEVLTVVQQLKFLARPGFQFPRPPSQGPSERVAGTQRAPDQIDALRELLLELPAAGSLSSAGPTRTARMRRMRPTTRPISS